MITKTTIRSREWELPGIENVFGMLSFQIFISGKLSEQKFRVEFIDIHDCQQTALKYLQTDFLAMLSEPWI
jgi:hypothetical protein